MWYSSKGILKMLLNPKAIEPSAGLPHTFWILITQKRRWNYIPFGMLQGGNIFPTASAFDTYTHVHRHTDTHTQTHAQNTFSADPQVDPHHRIAFHMVLRTTWKLEIKPAFLPYAIKDKSQTWMGIAKFRTNETACQCSKCKVQACLWWKPGYHQSFS